MNNEDCITLEKGNYQSSKEDWKTHLLLYKLNQTSISMM